MKCEFNNNFPERVTREIEYGDFIFYITEGEELLQIKASYSDESIFIHPYEVDDICSILQQLKKY